MAAPSPYLDHILARINADLDFLLSQSQLSVADAQVIRARLPAPNRAPAAHPTVDSAATSVTALSIASPQPNRTVPPVPGRISPPQSTGSVQRAQALWDYSSTTEGDLEFRKGDIIEILDTPNEFWYRGRLYGRDGIFPSNHVTLTSAQEPGQHMQPYQASAVSTPVHAGPPGPYGQYQAETKYQAVPYQSYQAPAQQVQQQAEPQKHSRFSAPKPGSFKSTLAHSAVGGLGFVSICTGSKRLCSQGAGTAIASEAIHAIF